MNSDQHFILEGEIAMLSEISYALRKFNSLPGYDKFILTKVGWDRAEKIVTETKKIIPGYYRGA